MKEEVRKDALQAKRRFIRIWPQIRQYCDGGDYLPVEFENNPALSAMDTLAGIDGLQVLPNEVRALSIRVQDDCRFSSWTIREWRNSGARTELEKLLNDEAFRSEGAAKLKPNLTVQAYVTENDRLRIAGVVDTIDLYRFIYFSEKEYPGRWVRRNTTSNAGFIYVNFSDFKINARAVLGYPPRFLSIVGENGGERVYPRSSAIPVMKPSAPRPKTPREIRADNERGLF